MRGRREGCRENSMDDCSLLTNMMIQMSAQCMSYRQHREETYAQVQIEGLVYHLFTFTGT